MVKGRQCWSVAVRTAHHSVLPRSRGQVYRRQAPDPERFDVVAYVLPDGVIRDEPPLARLYEPEPGAVAP